MIYFDSSKMLLMQDNLKVSFHLLNIFKFWKEKKKKSPTWQRLGRESGQISLTLQYFNVAKWILLHCFPIFLIWWGLFTSPLRAIWWNKTRSIEISLESELIFFAIFLGRRSLTGHHGLLCTIDLVISSMFFNKLLKFCWIYSFVQGLAPGTIL